VNRVFVGIVVLGCFVISGFAQPMRVDPAFNVELDGPVYALALQPDGKILIGGSFTNINGVTRRHLARLNRDGSLDETFNVAGDTIENPVELLVFADEKVYARIYGVNTRRYGTSGTFERSYSLYSGFVVDSQFRLIWGRWTGGSGYPRVGRLNEDGSVDPALAYIRVGCCLNQGVLSVAIQQVEGGEKILIGGDFDRVDTHLYRGIARLNGDGTVDTNFNGDAESPIFDIQNWNDGKFYTATRYMITRRLADGDIDFGFTPIYGNYGDRFYSIGLLTDGRVIALGEACGGSCNGFIRRFNFDGSIDTNFTVVVDRAVGPFAVQPDDAVLIAGQFTNVNCIRRTYLARLIPSDTPDPLPCVPPPPKPEPELTATRLRPAKMVCCWPTNYPEYTLQATRRLRPNHPEKEKWLTVTNAPVLGESTVCITNRILRWRRHYRLVQE
jgi:uncharacterized delta-60 repeat protein